MSISEMSNQLDSSCGKTNSNLRLQGTAIVEPLKSGLEKPREWQKSPRTEGAFLR